MPSNWVAGWYDKSISSFSKNLHIASHTYCTNLPSWQYIKCFPLSKSLPIFVTLFCTLDILTGIRWYLIVIFICVSLLASWEFFSIYLFTIYISSFENYHLRSLDHFLTAHWLDFFVVVVTLEFVHCWCIWYINPLSERWFANHFPHSVGCLFVLLIFSFAVQNLLSLM